jgi:transmembrane sensor
VEDQETDIFFQLISHKDFRDWVQHPTKERSYYWEKWMEANPEKIGDVQTAREFVERMVFKKNHLQSSEMEELLLKIVADEKPAKLSPGREFGSWAGKGLFLKAAAVFIVFLIATWVVNEVVERKSEAALASVKWKTVENPKGKKSKITLPDGSQVNLNYESSLKFPEAFQGKVRKVELIGEAFFDVQHNDTMPFIVVTGELETLVLGTTFNIRSKVDGQETDISLVTGKVKVNHTGRLEGTKSYDLSPGEQLRVHRLTGSAEKRPFDIQRVTAWKDGVIFFEDAGFGTFVGQLEKWYGVNFQIHGTAPQHWKINGSYQNETLEDILSGLSFVYGLEYKIQGNNVILNLQ